jgi:hypothetical protein
MKMNKLFKSACALASAAALLAPLAPMTAMAAPIDYTPVAGGSITIEKYLVMDSDTPTPAVTFSYSIAAGTAKSATSASDLEIYAGNDAHKVAGTPTIGTAVFAANQQQYNAAQDTENAAIQNKDDGTTLNKDGVTLAAGEVYSRSPITIDFSGVTFDEPGVYRYVVNETNSVSNTTATSGAFVFDTDLSRILDVYVIEDASNPGHLLVQGYVLHDNEDGTALNADGSGVADKADGFQNKYLTKNLLIGKHVAGNQASHDEYFKVHVEIANASASTTYQVDIAQADATTDINAINLEAHTNPATVTSTAAGAISQDFWLQGGTDQYIVIKGLPYGASYTINQDKTTMVAEGYEVTIDNADDVKTDTPADYVTTGVLGNETATDTDNDGEYDAVRENRGDSAKRVDVDFIDTRAGVIPTGVMLAVAPGAAVAAAGVAGLLVMAAKKRKKEEEEEE